LTNTLAKKGQALMICLFAEDTYFHTLPSLVKMSNTNKREKYFVKNILNGHFGLKKVHLTVFFYKK